MMHASMPPQNTVGRWLKTAFWRIFSLCHSVRCDRTPYVKYEREHEFGMFSTFSFVFFCLSRVHFIFWCCRTMHFHHPIKFHNHHLLVSRARATVWCRQTCAVSQNTAYCILSLPFYKRIEYLLLVFRFVFHFFL